MVEDTHSEAI